MPYVDQCGAMIGAMPDATFPEFAISKMVAFSDACRQALVLYERAENTGACSSETDVTVLQTRVDQVNRACCEQNGQNVCTNGAPGTCDSECAGVFLPCECFFGSSSTL